MRNTFDMRNTLLTTVATAALVGCTTLVLAQGVPKEGQSGPGMSQGQSLEQQNKGAAGGALKGEGNAPANPGGKTLGQSANEPKTLNQPGNQPNKGAERGAQERLGQGHPAQDQNQANPKRGAEEEHSKTNANSAQQRGAEDEHGKAGTSSTEQRTGQTTGHTQGSRGASVRLSQEQRTRIAAIVGKGHVAHTSNNVNFSVTVGAAVPRSVHVEVLPRDIVEVVPQYEGFDYVLVGDQILIVDPDTMEIVAIVPA